MASSLTSARLAGQALEMSTDQFDVSKAMIGLLVDNDVIFFQQYVAEARKLVVEVADAPGFAAAVE